MKTFTYRGSIHKVIDGDTYDVILDLGFCIAHKIRVRVRGIDTPEIFGNKATAEGKEASEYVKSLLEGKTVTITTYKTAPSTFNRWEADVVIEETKINVAEHLIEKGYAKKMIV
jgi:micrococcal nuclease